jgi:solute carrier family 26 (sodium-independent sulfate anion transporter), member 11
MAPNKPGEPISTKVGRGLAKVLGIKLDPNDAREEVSRGESVFSVATADTFVEEEPTSADWVQSLLPTSQGIKQYFVNLFPFLKWITRYNSTWFLGDTVAGKLPSFYGPFCS